MPRNWAGGRKTRAWTSDGDTSLLRADNAVERSSRISEGFKISESEDEEGFALGEAFGWEAETGRDFCKLMVETLVCRSGSPAWGEAIISFLGDRVSFLKQSQRPRFGEGELPFPADPADDESRRADY